MHNPRRHYNYLRLVSVHKYTVLVWFQYCVIIMNEIGGMRRRRRRRYEQEEEEEEEEQDEHTMEYNFPWNQTKGLTPWPVYNAD